MKQNNLNTYNKKFDFIFLDPKNFKRVSYVGTGSATILLIGFVLNQALLGKQEDLTAYYVLLGILIFLTIAILVISILLSIYRNKRLNQFNSINHESILIDKYRLNKDVVSIEKLDSTTNIKLIPNDLLISSFVPKFFNFQYKSNDYLLKFKDAKQDLHFSVSTYTNNLKYAKLSTENSRKILIAKLPSLYKQKFYLSKNIIHFDNPKFLIINSYEFKLEDSTNPYYYIYSEDNKAKLPIDLFNKELLSDFLFNQNKTNANFDVYNDENNAYLMCCVTNTFLDSSLRINESIKDFDRNLTKQAEYDLIVLNFIEKTTEILIKNLISTKDN